MDLLFPCGSWAILDFQLLVAYKKEKEIQKRPMTDSIFSLVRIKRCKIQKMPVIKYKKITAKLIVIGSI